MSGAQQEHTPSLLGFQQPPVLQMNTQRAPRPVATAVPWSTRAAGWDGLGGSGSDSGQHGQEQEAVLPSGFWQALPQAAGQHLRVLSQSPSDWHPTVQFTASVAGLGHTPALAARQRWGRGQAGAAGAGQGEGCVPFREMLPRPQGWVQGCCRAPPRRARAGARRGPHAGCPGAGREGCWPLAGRAVTSRAGPCAHTHWCHSGRMLPAALPTEPGAPPR